jgi:hypothetical protein
MQVGQLAEADTFHLEVSIHESIQTVAGSYWPRVTRRDPRHFHRIAQVNHLALSR